MSTRPARIQRVVITDLRDSTYFAILYLERDGEIFQIDARPSDAMVLALRTNAPIFVEEAVLDASGEDGGESGERLPETLEVQVEVDKREHEQQRANPEEPEGRNGRLYDRQLRRGRDEQ